MDASFETLFNFQIKEKYLTKREICYDASYPFHYDPFRYEKYLAYKEKKIQKKESTSLISLPIFSFSFPYLYYSSCFELENTLENYLEANHSLMSVFSISKQDVFNPNNEIFRSFLYSELEGSLNIENVPTTRKRVRELLDDHLKIENRNDQIIKNMKAGIDFVLTKPAFNKENLRHLYSLLSDGCLDQENLLRDGDYYRYDEVEVDGYPGCSSKDLEGAMNSLLDFVNESLKKKKYTVLLPFFAHYALVYYHPYFDYNGRTARMVSFWISLLEDTLFVPLFSEAINSTKSKYYLALEESRNNHNDITFFLLYLLRVSSRYCFLYMDIENLKEKGIYLTGTEQSYLRKIVMKASEKFTYIDFLSYAGIDISKQGALKILNHFLSLKILKASVLNKTKFFEVNKSCFPLSSSLPKE